MPRIRPKADPAPEPEEVPEDVAQDDMDGTSAGEEQIEHASAEKKKPARPARRASRKSEEPTPAADTDDVPLEDEEDVPASEEDEYLRALYYGVQGTGKTTATAKAILDTEEGSLLILNAEAGVKVRALEAQGIPVDRIRVWPKPGVRPTFDALERKILAVDAQMQKARVNGQPKPYAVIDMDSATELVKLMLDNLSDEMVEREREIARRQAESGRAGRTPNSRKRFRAERDDYQVVSGQMRAILRKLRYMDLHFLATALLRRDEDQDTGKVSYGPQLPPALQADLMGYMDVVIRTYIDDDGRFMGQTQPDESYMAKDRFGVLPADMVDPSAERVLTLIRGGSVVDSQVPAAQEQEGETEDAPAVEPEVKKPAARRSRAKKAETPSAVADDDEPPY